MSIQLKFHYGKIENLNVCTNSIFFSIVIILRGLPGSGKTHLAKMIKETEQQQGGPAPRILSLDDYFTVEKEFPVEGARKVCKVYINCLCFLKMPDHILSVINFCLFIQNKFQ